MTLRCLLIFAFFLSLGLCGHLNRIVEENKKRGARVEEWDISGAGDMSIQGFATRQSYLPGQSVDIKVDTPSTQYRVDFYRIGYYQGHGARLIGTARPHLPLPHTQPECYVDEATWLYDCGNWDVSVSWQIPLTAVSGIYFGRLVREDHPIDGATWRTDASKAEKDPHHKGEGEFEKPKPAKHAYGASGYGSLKNTILEPHASHVYFVVRDTSPSDIVVQASDITWQAYNTYGGTSTYGSFRDEDPRPRCYKASFNRPLNTREHRPTNTVWATEFPLIRWLEKSGYDVSYQSGIDTDYESTSELLKHRVFISSGHDEYWGKKQRQNVEEARNRGLNLMFLSGNEVFWKIRFESSPTEKKVEFPEECDHKPEAGDLTQDVDPYRTLCCYKESQSTVKIDPRLDMWTGTFRDSREINPDGPQPENALTGQIFTVNAWRDDPLLVPAEYRALRFWRNTSIASLQENRTAILKQGILGHEWDEDIDNGFRPPGLFRLSETNVDNVLYLQDFGETYDSGSATHNLVMYKHQKSGAIVFGAGTCQWSWGLDPMRQFGAVPHAHNFLNPRLGTDLSGTSEEVEQATANILADMRVFPLSLSPHLSLPSPSKDTIPPVSFPLPPSLSSPPLLSPSSPFFFMKFFSLDRGGGCLAALEVSINGSHFYPARRYKKDTDSEIFGDEHSDNPCSPTWVIEVPVTFLNENLSNSMKFSPFVADNSVKLQLKEGENQSICVTVRGVDDSGNIEETNYGYCKHTLLLESQQNARKYHFLSLE